MYTTTKQEIGRLVRLLTTSRVGRTDGQRVVRVKLPTALIGIVLIIGILVVLSMLRQPLGTLLALVQDQTALRQQVMAYGAWAPLLLAVIQLAQVILAFIPGHVLMIAAGYLYGLSGGFALNLITIVAASQLAFVLARRAGRPLVERLVPPHVMARVEERSGSGDVLLLAIGFLVPILPGDALNLLAGLSGISGQRFLLANLVGRLPAVLLWTLVGSHGIQLSPMVWAVIAAVAAVVGIVWMARSHLAAVLPGRAGEARRGNRLGVTFGG